MAPHLCDYPPTTTNAGDKGPILMIHGAIKESSISHSPWDTKSRQIKRNYFQIRWIKK